MPAPRTTTQPLTLHRVPPRRAPQVPERSEDCIPALRALGEDTRARIVGLLIDAPLDVSEITDQVGVSQYNVSKHLRILREAGLVQSDKLGRRHVYRLADGVRDTAASTGVIDLGCCSFKFTAAPRRASRRSTRRS